MREKLNIVDLVGSCEGTFGKRHSSSFFKVK